MGHNEEPTPNMASAGFERAEQARFDCKAHLLKVPEHGIGSQGHMPFDVFKEASFGIEFPNDEADVGPEVAGILFASSTAGEAEGLAWICLGHMLGTARYGLFVPGEPNRQGGNCDPGILPTIPYRSDLADGSSGIHVLQGGHRH